ncbi:MAG: hypothetical protein AAFN27_23490 [Pseudomonadota bacterium]
MFDFVPRLATALTRSEECAILLCPIDLPDLAIQDLRPDEGPINIVTLD